MPAPIVLTCFNRPLHLKRTIEALQKNKLATDSIIYIFADGPKLGDEENEKKVADVHQYIESIKGFKSVIKSYSPANKGLANSVINAVSQVLKTYNAVIVMEDDLIVSTDFLEFMNEALVKYQNYQKIFSVSGYSYLLENLALEDDLFIVKRASSWGWGTWANRWETVDWQMIDLIPTLKNKESRNNFINGGKDLLSMIKKQYLGKIDSWAIRWTYHHFKNNAYCLVPKFSKVENIGTDGSGTHFSNKTDRYFTKIVEKKLILPDTIDENIQATHYIRNQNKPSFLRRLINFFTLGV